MKALGSSVPKLITLGTQINCTDNSGAKILEVIGVQGYRGRRRRRPKAGVGDVVVASVKKGDEKMRKKVVKAVVVRQKKEFRRPNGMRIQFADNAAVVLKEGNLAQGSEIKGAVAQEVAIRFPKVATLAKSVL